MGGWVWVAMSYHLLAILSPPEKRLKDDKYTADVERGFTAQNVICIGQKGNILHFKF